MITWFGHVCDIKKIVYIFAKLKNIYSSDELEKRGINRSACKTSRCDLSLPFGISQILPRNLNVSSNLILIEGFQVSVNFGQQF